MIDDPNEELDATPIHFAKIYGTILDSSIWEEPDHTVRVWIAMLAMADAHGIVRASYSGLRRRCNVSMEKLAEALETLEAPDPDSRNPENEGRRVKKIKGGWFIYNAKLYRDMRTEEQVETAERVKRWRARQRSGDQGVTGNAGNVTGNAEVEVEGEVEEELPPHRVRAGEGLVPMSYWTDFDQLFTVWPQSGRQALMAEIVALLDGMHGPSVPNEIMGRAIRDYVASAPRSPSLKHFRSFVRGIEKEDHRVADVLDATPAPRGHTLRAGEIINIVKACRNTLFPQTTTPEWREKLSQPEVRAVNAIGVGRILGEDKPGIVLSQLAKMLGEAQ